MLRFFLEMEGSSIGQYRIVRKLGQGGMGTVWLGEHTLLGRRAAIKVLLPEYSNNTAIVQRFFNEARAVTAIADPGIVQVFDFGHANGSAFIVMELLEGEAMDTRLKRIGRFMPADAIRLMAQIATSLGAAHAKGVIHRDLKPENIFIVGDQAVTGGERTKVLDFGIAKLTGEGSGVQKTHTGMIMGTPVFMSPEQCRGASTIDARSDIYTLGCVLFTMLCGRPPFESEGSGDLIIMHVRDAPPPPSSVVPSLIPELDAFVLRCLEKDPNRRFQNTNEMVHGLAQVEAALFGIGPEGSRQSMQMQAGYVSSPGTGPGARRSAHTPAAGIAYRQQLTPQHQAATRIATDPGAGTGPGSHPGTSPTTLSSANMPLATAQQPRSKAGWIVGVVALLAIAGVAIAVTMGKKSETPAASEPTEAPPVALPVANTADAGVLASPDAAVAAMPDAAIVAATDAAVVVPDAAEVAVTVDAGVTAKPAGKRDKKRGGTKQGGSNATSSSGSGTVDRGD